jgi:hypothetical protein
VKLAWESGDKAVTDVLLFFQAQADGKNREMSAARL